jgi:hypothetical protein
MSASVISEDCGSDSSFIVPTVFPDMLAFEAWDRRKAVLSCSNRSVLRGNVAVQASFLWIAVCFGTELRMRLI